MISDNYAKPVLPLEIKKTLLEQLYALHAKWLAPMGLACGKGCAACCTQSVTMTSIEGELIVDFLRQQNRLDSLDEVLAAHRCRKTSQPPLTTNAFAEYCLRGVEPEEPVHEDWDFTPCPFLHDEVCTIYTARPFGCRAFVSTVDCSKTGSAEIAPMVLTVNTVFTQIIEHIDQGNYWGKMLDILACSPIPSVSPQTNTTRNPENAAGSRLRRAKRLPGLLVSEIDKKPVQSILDAFFSRTIDGKKIETLLNVKPGLWQ